MGSSGLVSGLDGMEEIEGEIDESLSTGDVGGDGETEIGVAVESETDTAGT